MSVYSPVILSGVYFSDDTQMNVVVHNPVTFEVTKDKEYYVARNADLGVHSFAKEPVLLKQELVEEIAFILKFVQQTTPKGVQVSQWFKLEESDK